MSRAISPVSRWPYGVAAVCRVWRIARSGIYRDQAPSLTARRPGPMGPMPDAALVDNIRLVLATSRFHGEGHRKSGHGCATGASSPRGGGSAD
jgi:hypothetical protein